MTSAVALLQAIAETQKVAREIRSEPKMIGLTLLTFDEHGVDVVKRRWTNVRRRVIADTPGAWYNRMRSSRLKLIVPERENLDRD